MIPDERRTTAGGPRLDPARSAYRLDLRYIRKIYFAGERPQIEAFLDRVDGPTKQPLLLELLELEIHIRRIRGETIAIAEYQARFPGLSAARLEESLRTSPDPSPNNHRFSKTPAADLQKLDCGSQPSQTGNPKIVKYFGDYELLNIIAQGGIPGTEEIASILMELW